MERLIAIFSVLSVIAMQSCEATSQKQETNDTLKKDTDSLPAQITLLFAGDIMQHAPQIRGALQADGTYDYTECFRFISSEISDADISVANFETTLAGPPYTGYPTFSCPDELLRDCKAAGFDVFLTANNHTCDKGRKGIERTIEMMDSMKVQHLGTYTDSIARERQYPFLLEKNGFKIVLLNYTYGTNGIPIPPPDVVNIIDTVQIAADISEAKRMNPDAIIAFMHWGVEYTINPVKSQELLADWLIRKGVTHVIGGHPHVPEPIEIREDDYGNKHVVAYSLGNFVSNQSTPYTYGGMLVKMTLEKDSTTRMSDCHYSLYFVTRPAMSVHKQHRVYPVSTPDSLINPAEIRLRDSFVNSIRPFFEKNNKNIREIMTFDISAFAD